MLNLRGGGRAGRRGDSGGGSGGGSVCDRALKAVEEKPEAPDLLDGCTIDFKLKADVVNPVTGNTVRVDENFRNDQIIRIAAQVITPKGSLRAGYLYYNRADGTCKADELNDPDYEVAAALAARFYSVKPEELLKKVGAPYGDAT